MVPELELELFRSGTNCHSKGYGSRTGSRTVILKDYGSKTVVKLQYVIIIIQC